MMFYGTHFTDQLNDNKGKGMRKIVIWLVVGALSLALVNASYASDASQFFAKQGRIQAFNGGSPTIEGLRAADNSFQTALVSDPLDQQAHFFRAISRVLTSVAEQASDGGLTTLRKVMEAFGFSWEGYEAYFTYLPPTPSPSVKASFLEALNSSLLDLGAITDTTFTVTLMGHQDHSRFPTIVVTHANVLTVKAMMENVRALVVNAGDWDIIALKQLIIDGSSGLTTAQHDLLHNFVNPFGYVSMPGLPFLRPDLDQDRDIDGLDLTTCAAEMNAIACSPSTLCPCDLNGDGTVNAIDLQLFLDEYALVY